MRLVVVFTPEAESQLLALYLYIAEAASPDISERYTDAVVNYCESHGMFPRRGALRDDIRPGLRVTHYRGRTVIAFTVLPERVEILGVFHGGRDFPIFYGSLICKDFGFALCFESLACNRQQRACLREAQ